MQSLTAFLDESLDGTIGRGGFEQLNRCLAGFQNRDAHLLLGHFLDTRQLQTERVDPEFLRLVDALHRDANVVDTLDHTTPRFRKSANCSSVYPSSRSTLSVS